MDGVHMIDINELVVSMTREQNYDWPRDRSCYADEISMDKNDFLKMLLLDGCFILISSKGLEGPMQEQQASNNSNRGIEWRLHENNAKAIINDEGTEDEVRSQDTQRNARHEVDEEYSSPTDLFYIQHFWHDILLLKNQIPFFLVKALHELIADGVDTSSKFVENIMESMEGVLGFYPTAICKSNRPKNFHHLLHLCHLYLKPCSAETDSCENHLEPPLFHNFLWLGSNFFSKFKQRSSDEGFQAWQQASPWHRATEYHQTGISFKKRTFSCDNPHSLLDIVFCKGILLIPCLTIDPNTYSLFCNLIAFEQTCPQFGSCFTSYIVFLSHLLSKPDDVSLLTERSIIVHQLNSDADVSDLFKIVSECIVSNFNSYSYLQPLWHRIEAHYQIKRPILRELFSSISSKFHGWTQTGESSALPVSMSTGTSI